MPSAPFNASVSVTPPNGGQPGQGSANTNVDYQLNDANLIEAVSAGVNIEMGRVSFPEEQNPVIGGWFHVQIDAWGIDDDVRMTMNRRAGTSDYRGAFFLEPVPEKLRALVEGRVPAATRDETLVVASVGSESVQRPAGRQLSAAVSLVEAKGHIDAAKALIQKYINDEPVPDDFGLAILDGLLREVDGLGDQLEGIISNRLVTPEADRSVSVIEWIKNALILKAGLDELVEVLEAVINVFA